MRKGLLLLLALAGCVASPPREAPRGEAEPRAAGEPTLEASDEAVSGVVLPKGLAHAYDLEAARVYRTDLPTPQVFAFFASRHPDAAVERVGEGGVLRRVPVRLDDGTARHVDVSVLGRSNGGARVQITLLPAPSASLPPPEERLRQFVEHARTLD